MFKFILKRIALMFPLMIVVSFMTFLLTYITNENPAVTILHAQGTPNVTPELIAETNEKYGFNDPLLIQYKNWLLEAMQFNFGTSYITGDPVAERIGPAFMNTLKLTIISSVMVMITSIILGVVSALKEESSLIVRYVQWLYSNCITIILDSFNTYYLRFSEVKHIADFWINRSRKLHIASDRYYDCLCWYLL